jgi:hypothetical protein
MTSTRRGHLILLESATQSLVMGHVTAAPAGNERKPLPPEHDKHDQRAIRKALFS